MPDDDRALAQRGGQRRAFVYGWRAKTKLAEEGSTSKPCLFNPRVNLSLPSITRARLC